MGGSTPVFALNPEINNQEKPRLGRKLISHALESETPLTVTFRFIGCSWLNGF
jgi:hypothetical protein